MLALALAGGGWFSYKTSWGEFRVPAYSVLRVLDGDTFETTDKQMIRLDGVDAPAIEHCGGKEAKEELEKLITGQPLYLKLVFRDRYNRLIGLAYTPRGFVNSAMVRSGWAKWPGYRSANDPEHEMKSASDYAKTNKLGILSPLCSQTTNPKKPKCSVMGNIIGDKKSYRFPGCGQYHSTVVELYRGEEWFCSEDEARKAGYVKGSDCFEQTF